MKKEIIPKEAPISNVTYFECGKRGHVKSKCPTLENKNKYFKSNKDKIPNKAYVACDDNEISSSSYEDHANKAFMASHHSCNEEYEVSDYELMIDLHMMNYMMKF